MKRARGRFWWTWLLAWSAFFVVFGAVSAISSSLPPASFWGDWVADGLMGGTFTERERTLFDFMRGPLGGTMAGSYVMQTALVAIPIRRGEAWAWWAVLVGVFVWFLIDSSVSAFHDAYFNILRVNLFALVVTVAGLVGCRPMVANRGQSSSVSAP